MLPLVETVPNVNIVESVCICPEESKLIPDCTFQVTISLHSSYNSYIISLVLRWLVSAILGSWINSRKSASSGRSLILRDKCHLVNSSLHKSTIKMDFCQRLCTYFFKILILFAQRSSTSKALCAATPIGTPGEKTQTNISLTSSWQCQLFCSCILK